MYPFQGCASLIAQGKLNIWWSNHSILYDGPVDFHCLVEVYDCCPNSQNSAGVKRQVWDVKFQAFSKKLRKISEWSAKVEIAVIAVFWKSLKRKSRLSWKMLVKPTGPCEIKRSLLDQAWHGLTLREKVLLKGHIVAWRWTWRTWKLHPTWRHNEVFVNQFVRDNRDHLHQNLLLRVAIRG